MRKISSVSKNLTLHLFYQKILPGDLYIYFAQVFFAHFKNPKV
jgi:hypothetical protein